MTEGLTAAEAGLGSSCDRHVAVRRLSIGRRIESGCFMGQSVKEAHGQHLEMGNLGNGLGEPFLLVEEASSWLPIGSKGNMKCVQLSRGETQWTLASH